MSFAARLVTFQGQPPTSIFPQCLSGDGVSCFLLSGTDVCYLLGNDGNCQYNSCPSICMPQMIGLGPPVACGPIIENPFNFPPLGTLLSPAYSGPGCEVNSAVCPAGAAWDICNALSTLTTLGWNSVDTSGVVVPGRQVVVNVDVFGTSTLPSWYPQVATYMVGPSDYVVIPNPNFNANNIDFANYYGLVNAAGTVVTPSPCHYPYNGTNSAGCTVPTALPLMCSMMSGIACDASVDVLFCGGSFDAGGVWGADGEPCCPGTSVYPTGSPWAGQSILWPNPQAAVCQCPPPELQPNDNSLSCPNPTRGPLSNGQVVDCPGCCGPIDWHQMAADICNQAPSPADNTLGTSGGRKILSTAQLQQQQRTALVDLREGYVTIDKVRILPSFKAKLPSHLQSLNSKRLLSKIRSALLDSNFITAEVVKGDSTKMKGAHIDAFLRPGGTLTLYVDSILNATSNTRLANMLSSGLYNDNETGLIRAHASNMLQTLPFCPLASGNVVHMWWKLVNYTDFSVVTRKSRTAEEKILLEAMVGAVEIHSTIAKMAQVKRHAQRDPDYHVFLGA